LIVLASPASARRHALHASSIWTDQPVQRVGVELKAEILGHRVGGVGPMRLAGPFVGAQVEAVLLLPQVVGDVDVAQQRQLVADLLRPVAHGGNLLEDQVLVAHHHHRHGAPAEGLEPFADALGVVAGGVHHDLAADVALFGMDDPLAVLAADAGGGAEAQDRGAQVARALGQRLGQLRGVDVAIGGVVERALQVMGLDEGILVRISSGDRISRFIPW
jgi:hypothetical protein